MHAAPATHRVFVTGATGYIGRSLTLRLVQRGHAVRALVRDAARARDVLPAGAELVEGDALDANTFAERVAPCDTLVHLVGTPKPAPWKARAFRAIDGRSAHPALAAARSADVRHFVYLSVAQPAPVMRAYIAVRAECEAAIAASGIAATFVRPWYVLGPGHRWPLVLAPLYAVLARLPSTRESAERLGLVDLDHVVAALAQAVEAPPRGVRVIATREIRASSGREA